MPSDRVRIPLLALELWDEELSDISEALAKGIGRIPNVFSAMANHPKLLRRMNVFGAHVIWKNSIPARERELLVLRTALNCQAEYEWSQHQPSAAKVPIDDADMERVLAGPTAEGWSEHEAALLRLADELHVAATVSDATWETLAKTYSPIQMLDTLATVGHYHSIAFILNSCGVPLDEGTSGFPEVVSGRADRPEHI